MPWLCSACMASSSWPSDSKRSRASSSSTARPRRRLPTSRWSGGHDGQCPRRPEQVPSSARAPANAPRRSVSASWCRARSTRQHVATTHRVFSRRPSGRDRSGDGPVELLETGPRTADRAPDVLPSVARTSASRSASPLSRASSRAARSSPTSLVGSTLGRAARCPARDGPRTAPTGLRTWPPAVRGPGRRLGADRRWPAAGAPPLSATSWLVGIVQPLPSPPQHH